MLFITSPSFSVAFELADNEGNEGGKCFSRGNKEKFGAREVTWMWFLFCFVFLFKPTRAS